MGWWPRAVGDGLNSKVELEDWYRDGSQLPLRLPACLPPPSQTCMYRHERTHTHTHPVAAGSKECRQMTPLGGNENNVKDMGKMIWEKFGGRNELSLSMWRKNVNSFFKSFGFLRGTESWTRRKAKDPGVSTEGWAFLYKCVAAPPG